jgi:hypothetical protein
MLEGSRRVDRLAEHVEGWPHAFLQYLVWQGLLLVRRLVEKPLETGLGSTEDVLLLPLEVLEVDGDDLGFDLDGIEVKPSLELLGATETWISPPGSCILGPTILRLLGAKVSLLALSEVLIKLRVLDDVAEDLKTFANEFSPLSDVWIEHIQMAYILIANVTGPRAHAWSPKKSRDEGFIAVPHGSSKPFPLGLWQWLSSGWIESFVGVVVLEDLEETEATPVNCLVLSSFALSLSLVRDLEVLSRQ